MNIWKIGIAGFFCGIVATACATTSSSSGSNSNWLAVCASSSDCSGGLECWCGVCTKPCTTTSDCTSFGAGAKCDPDLSASICGSQTTQNACAVGCKSDADCSTFDAGGRCVNGTCRETTATTAADGGIVTCNDRLSEAEAHFSAVVEAAEAGANGKCTVDGDCVSAPVPSCLFGCGLPFVPQGIVATLQSEIPSIDKNFCDPYLAAGCAHGPNPYCPAFGPPKCVAGRCYDKFSVPPDGGAPADSGGLGATDAGSGPLTCQGRTSQISDRIQADVAGADHACANDIDCTTVALDNRCYHACQSAPLSQSGAATVNADLGTLESELCPAFEAAGCTALVPPCVAPQPVKCVSNACAFASR